MLNEAADLWYLLIPLAFFGGLAAGTTGFGIYLVFGPILWSILTPTAALATGLAAGLPALVLLFYLKSALSWQRVYPLVLWSLPGVLFGLLVHLTLSASLLRVFASSIILLLLFLSWKGGHVLSLRIAGFSAGSLGSSVGFNGPPVAFAYLDKGEREQRANTILSLFFISLATAASFIISGLLFQGKISTNDFLSGYLIGLALIPLVSLGLYAGNHLAEKIGKKIETAAFLVSLIGVALLLLRGFNIL